MRKKIEGYPKYEITNDGRIWSEYKKKWIIPFENIIKNRPNSQYYLRIGLVNKGIRKKFMVHRLVAMAYIPNPKNKPFINHKNGNKHDNRVENLEWVTTSENSIHYINKLNKNLKISNEDVLEIRSDKYKGWKNTEIAKIYNVSREYIRDIKKNRVRKIIDAN